MKKMAKKKIKLPTTHEGFQSLVDMVVKKYGYSNPKHAASVIAVKIMHLPTDQSQVELDYFARCIDRNLAHNVADQMNKRANHEFGIDQIEQELSLNPNNQQAWDDLEKAVEMGSPYAKDAKNRLERVETVTPMPRALASVPEAPEAS